MSDVFIDDKGFRDLLLKLEPKELRKITKPALKAGAQIVRKQAVKNYKALFPGSQKYRGIVAMPFRDGLGAWIKAAIYGEKKREKINTKYGGNIADTFYVLNILENGTGDRFTGKNGGKKAARGRVRAYRFFRDAEAAKRDEAIKVIEIKLREKFEKMQKK